MRSWRLLPALASLAAARPVGAEEAPAPPEPEVVAGVEDEQSHPDDAVRAVGNVVLWPLRWVVEGVFFVTGVAGGVVEDEQVVPRVNDLLDPPPGEVRVFPTAFVETGFAPSIGLRMITRGKHFASTARAGFGGIDSVVVESRLKVAATVGVPASVGLEVLGDRRERSYLGLGQTPATDTRNRFVPGAAGTAAKFREERGRFIGSLGIRPLSDFEVLLSSSVTRRTTEDPRDPDATAMSRVFEPGSVPSALATTSLLYDEIALRLDTRRSRGGPSGGVVLEAYVGRTDGIVDTEVTLGRAGGRAAAYVPVVRSSTILSPRIVLDGVSNLGDSAIPFTELAGAPSYRGSDDRADLVSAVASLDYRWAIWTYVATRVFVDATTVAPSVDALDPAPEKLRWAAGGGLDLFSRSTTLGAIAASGGTDGLRVLVEVGISSGFGDRQHRR